MQREAPNRCALCNDFCYHFVCACAYVAAAADCCSVRGEKASIENRIGNKYGNGLFREPIENRIGNRYGNGMFREQVENRMGNKIGNRYRNGLSRQPIGNRIGNKIGNNEQERTFS